MPSATARDIQRVARALGFVRRRQTGSHERWNHTDGRAVTIPLHGGREIGRLVPGSSWGTMGIAPGAIWGFHYFTTDSEGNLYVGEDMAFRIQKFVPRADGSPVQLIGQLVQ
jgi:predicted RNA binding protein YcfA (HicA-like mRNA interferase family)